MSNHMFNYEKEIKKLEKQLIKLSKNTREKFNIEIQNELNLLISRKTKEIKNKLRLNKIDQNKKNTPAKSTLSNENLEKLPSWVKDQIDKYDEYLYDILVSYVKDEENASEVLEEFKHDRHSNDWIDS